jgi:DNA polymerase-1
MVFNFFRAIKPLIEIINPDKAIMVLEGYPKFRHDLYPEYKANRRAEPEGTPKFKEFEDFRRQKAIILELMKSFPIDIMYHNDYECDDVISVLVKKVHKDNHCTVVSNDTDFIQLYNSSTNFELYSPVKKEMLKPTTYDYISWKALVGDTADNISGVPRIGAKTATKLLENSDGFNNWFDDHPGSKDIYERNLELIRFSDFDPKEIIIEPGVTDFEAVRSKFEELEFSSIIEDKQWAKYKQAFDNLKS